uniref:Annexin n=1 Tax=Strongyloides stercoralis TaxID=6248 RepID=A0AAF5D0S4_STRER
NKKMSGFGDFLAKSLKGAAEDLVKSKFSSFKGENSNDNDSMKMKHKNSPYGKQQPYDGFQGMQGGGGGGGMNPSRQPQQPYSNNFGQQPQPYLGNPGQQQQQQPPYLSNLGQQSPYLGNPGQQPFPQQPGYGDNHGGQQHPQGAPSPYGLNPQVTGGFGGGGPTPQSFGSNQQYGQGPGGHGLGGQSLGGHGPGGQGLGGPGLGGQGPGGHGFGGPGLGGHGPGGQGLGGPGLGGQSPGGHGFGGPGLGGQGFGGPGLGGQGPGGQGFGGPGLGGQGPGGQGFPGSSSPYGDQHNPMNPGVNGYNPSQYVHQMGPQAGRMTLGNPSIKEYPNFNPSIDAESLRKAMKGLGCNNTRVIEIICKRSNFQRQQICRLFQQMYGKDLINELKSELYGDFEDLIIALMKPSAEYDAAELRRAVEGLGTNENILIEIMTSRTNSQIRDIKNAYKYLYNVELESDIRGDTSGYFKRLLVALSTGYRDESNYIDINNAQQSAKSLYSAGEGRLGTDESTFLSILCSQNFAQLNLVFEEYHKLTGRTIDVAIKNEFSGDIKDALLALYHIITNRPGYFALQLENSMKGFGTRDKDLIRLVVTRCEIDMVDIRNEFQRMYGRSLEKTIEGDTSGSYKNALITLVKGN